MIGLTLYGVFYGEDLQELMQDVAEANWNWLAVCMLLVVLFIYCESFILRLLFSKLGIPIRRREAFLFSGVGFFFSCVTPSASGGQPAQLVYMRKSGIRASDATNVLMWVTVLYKLVLVIIGVFLLLFRADYVNAQMDDCSWLFYFGIALNIAFVGFLILLWCKSHWLERVGKYWIQFFSNIHIIKKKEYITQKWTHFIEGYDASFVAMKGQTRVIAISFLVTFMQRIMLFAITGFVYISFGLRNESFWNILMLQAMISISVDMLPLPGGSGITEHLFEVMFLNVFGGELLLPGMVLSRGIAYYVQLLFCGVMTIFAHFYFERSEKIVCKNR